MLCILYWSLFIWTIGNPILQLYIMKHNYSGNVDYLINTLFQWIIRMFLWLTSIIKETFNEINFPNYLKRKKLESQSVSPKPTFKNHAVVSLNCSILFWNKISTILLSAISVYFIILIVMLLLNQPPSKIFLGQTTPMPFISKRTLSFPPFFNWDSLFLMEKKIWV